MILVKLRQVIMAAAVYPDQGDLMRVKFLQPFAVPDRDQPIARAMNDVGMAIYFPDPFICAQVIPQYEFYGEDGKKNLEQVMVKKIGRME